MDQQTSGRYRVVPRTLIFLRRHNAILLLRGAAHKWFAGQYNGVGGHVEPGETILDAARREVVEETGLHPTRLDLRAVVHIPNIRKPGVILFVFVGEAEGEPTANDEGTLEWVTEQRLDQLPLVPDLRWLLPRILHAEHVLYLTFEFGRGGMTIHTADGETYHLRTEIS